MGRTTILLFMLVGMVMLAGLAAAGDLTVVSIGFDPSKEEGIYAGQTLRVNARVRNNGTQVNSSSLEFYIEETLITTRMVTNLNPGQELFFEVEYHSSKGDNGNKKFTALLTEEDDNTANNERFDTYYIKQAMPDLTPKSLSFDRDLIVDNYVTLTARIENKGTDSANSIDVRLMQDTDTLTTETIGVLIEGGQKDVMLSFLLEEAGTFNFSVRVDPSNTIEEMSEENNQLTLQDDVVEPGPGDLPDFDPVVLEWPDTYARGQTISVTVRVWNNGTRGYSDDDVNVTLALDDDAIVWTTASMPANYYDEITFEWTITEAEGGYNLSVAVDPLTEEDESDEENNVETIGIEIVAPLPRDHPDLSIIPDDIDLFVGSDQINESGSVVEDEVVQIRLFVRNLGNMTAVNVTVSILIDDEPLVELITDVPGGWDPPAQRTLLEYWTALRGQHTIGVWLDRNGTDGNNETDGQGNTRRENNYAERDINVVEGALPDFYVDPSKMSLKADGIPVTTVEENTTVNLTFDVTNQGEVGGTLTVIVFDSSLPMPQDVSGVSIARFSVELGIGESAAYWREWDINGTGVHYLRAMALNSTGNDIDFSNNEAQVAITVVGEALPDIVLANLRLNDTAPLRNGSVRIRFSIRNVGDKTVSEHFQVLFTLVGDREYPFAAVWHNDTIEVNATANVTYDWDLGSMFKAGLYELWVSADDPTLGSYSFGEVREFDEGNNQGYVNITIRALQAPDVELRASDIRVDQAWNPVDGEPLPWANPVKREDMAIVSGRTMVLRVPVYNEGNTDMDQLRVNWSFRSLEEETYNLKGERNINQTIPLPPGEKTIVEFNIEVPARTETQLWELKAAVEVLESGTNKENSRNMMNNYFTTQVWVIPDHPDPAVLSLRYSPEMPFINDDVAFSVVVANLGPADLTEDLKLLVDGTAVDFFHGNGTKKSISMALAAGTRLNVTMVYSFDSEKTYVVRARINANLQLDDGNDFIETEIYVRPIIGTELTITNVNIPGTVYLGEETVIIVSIRNDGSEGAEVVTVRVTIEGREVIAERATSIAPLDSETLDIAWIPDDLGSFSINVTVNPDRDIPEIDYTNNIYYSNPVNMTFPTVTVAERPPEDGPAEEEVPVFIIAGVVIASVAAGIGIFLLLRRK